MTLTFPTNPTIGQEFSGGGKTWAWTGAAWETVAATSSVALPEGAKTLITSGYSSSSAYTYTPTTSLPAGSYMLTASPCESIYVKLDGKVSKSSTGKVLIKSTTPISSISFEAEQLIDTNATLDIPHPIPLSMDESQQLISTSNFYLGSANGVHYGYRGSRLVKSLDAVHWVETGLTIGASGYSFEHRDRVFAAGSATVITAENFIITSTDNFKTWTRRNHGLSVAAYAYGNGTLVAFAGSGNIRYYTTNLSTWTSAGTSSAYIRAVIFAGNQFVATSQGVVETSPDGVTWTVRTTTAGSGLVYGNLAYSGSLYMFINDTGVCYTSPNAVTWTQKATFPPANSSARNLIWLNGVFAAIQDSTGNYYTSADGTTWTLVTPGYFVGNGTTQKAFYRWRLNESGTQLFKIGYHGANTSAPFEARTTDLSTWKSYTSTSYSDFTPMRFAKAPDGLYFGETSSPQIFKTTDNGITWDTWNPYNSTQYNLRSFTYGGGKFIGVGQVNGFTYDVAWTSDDAKTWITGTSQMGGYASNGRGDGDYLYTSATGAGYVARIDSSRTIKQLSTGQAWYFINAIGEIAYYNVGGSLYYVDWSLSSPTLTACYSTSANNQTGVSSAARIYYMNGVYIFVSWDPTTNLVTQFRSGVSPDRFYTSHHVANTSKFFIGEINESLYFYGDTSVPTYNPYGTWPLYRFRIGLDGVRADAVPVGSFASVVTLKKFDSYASIIGGGRFNGMPPGDIIVGDDGTGSFRGVSFLQPSSGTVFSLYTVTDQTYN